ncbi:hypothetical protein EAD89_29400 [Micromonospora sp. BL4]|nr:hypothetical protein EAD89_29400 [Micromonospora sp. BL4]
MPGAGGGRSRRPEDLPLIFGVLGVIAGIVGALLGDKPLGWHAAAASVVAAVISMVIFSGLINN